MTVTRWTLSDGLTTYTFPINPNDMTTVEFARPKQASPSLLRPSPMGLETHPAPVEWSFRGRAYSQEQYDDLLAWSQVENPVTLTDHLGRTFTILITSFAPTDLRRPHTTERWNYEVRALILERTE